MHPLLIYDLRLNKTANIYINMHPGPGGNYQQITAMYQNTNHQFSHSFLAPLKSIIYKDHLTEAFN